MQSRLDAFSRRRSSRWDIDWSESSVGATLLRELSTSILPSGDAATWRRRPSISLDGTPIILSCKIGRRVDDALRLLVEPGSYAMTVAQQVAFSLTRLDRLLGLLGWRGAAAEINSITTRVFPSDPAVTSSWWGGIWLGANVPLSAAGPSSDADLRLYLNLRHGTAATRWRTLTMLVSQFVPPSLRPVVDQWSAAVSPHAIPVGLGVVVATGRVCAMRAYVGVYNPTLESLSVSSSVFASATPRELARAHNSFADRFGLPPQQAITIGYDFIRDMTKAQAMAIGRVKVDFCCHIVAPERRDKLTPWIELLLAEWRFDSCSLTAFLDDVHAIWENSEVQFLSLGFAPSLNHVTVYVKPGA